MAKMGRPLKDKQRKAVARAMLAMDLEDPSLREAGEPPKIPYKVRGELSRYFKLAMELACIRDREQELTADIWME